MNERATRTIDSCEQLQERITEIVDELNHNRRLALAAAVNPFLALEELGYHVRDDARAAIEDRLRFPPKEAARRVELRDQIFEQVKHAFDLNSSEALRTVLYDELALRPYPDARGCYPALPETHPPRRSPSGRRDSDPLQALAGRHPVIELLLEYRRLDALHPYFASQKAYDAIRTGTVDTPIRKLRIRFKGEPNAPNRDDASVPHAPGRGRPRNDRQSPGNSDG